jgi:hypothetical protein
VLRRRYGETEWQTVADMQAMPSSLVHDDIRLCWATSDASAFDVRCVAKTGGPIYTVTRLAYPPTLALSDGQLVWTDTEQERVMTLSINEIGPPQPATDP